MDPCLAFLLIEANGQSAEAAFDLPHNSKRRVDMEIESGDPKVRRTRESTPLLTLRKRSIQLSLDQKPFDLLMGYCFGSDEDVCDIQLDTTKTRGVSTRAFSINYNRVSGQLELRSLAKGGILFEEGSRHLRPRLLEHLEVCTLKPQRFYKAIAGSVNLSLKPVHEEMRTDVEQHKFNQNLIIYGREVELATPRLDGLDLNKESPQETPAVDVYHGVNNDYSVVEEIGRGGYATVCQAFDVTDCELFALKKFHPEKYKKKDYKGEIHLLQSLKHPCIVRYVDCSMDDAPLGFAFLVTEYLGSGTLEVQHHRRKFEPREVETILHDMLSALCYIHNIGIVHHDLTPKNIVVHVRVQYKLIIKLVDFGLSKADPVLIRAGGCPDYGAPEMFVQGGSFSEKIDIWGLGLIALEYFWTLPKDPMAYTKQNRPSSPYAKGWQGNIRKEVDAFVKADPVRVRQEVSGLVDRMLKMNYKERATASQGLVSLQQCYEPAYFLSNPANFGIPVKRGLEMSDQGPRKRGEVYGGADPNNQNNRDVDKERENYDKVENIDGNRGHQGRDDEDPDASVYEFLEVKKRGVPRPLTTLISGCYLVSLDQILRSLKSNDVDFDAIKLIAFNQFQAWRIKSLSRGIELFINVEDAASLIKEFGPLATEVIQLLRRMADITSRDENDQRVRLLNAVNTGKYIVVFLFQRMVLVRASDGHIHVPSFLKACCNGPLVSSEVEEDDCAPLSNLEESSRLNEAQRACLRVPGQRPW